LKGVWAGDGNSRISKPLTPIIEPFYSLLFIALPTLLPNLVGYTISLPIKLPTRSNFFTFCYT